MDDADYRPEMMGSSLFPMGRSGATVKDFSPRTDAFIAFLAASGKGPGRAWAFSLPAGSLQAINARPMPVMGYLCTHIKQRRAKGGGL